MWKNAKEELPPPYELVLLQLIGDEYATGYWSPRFNDKRGAWNVGTPRFWTGWYEIEADAVEKWCKIVRPYDAPDGE